MLAMHTIARASMLTVLRYDLLTFRMQINHHDGFSTLPILQPQIQNLSDVVMACISLSTGRRRRIKNEYSRGTV